MAAPHVAGAVALFLQGTAQPVGYTAFASAHADLLGSRAQATRNGSRYVNGWGDTSGKAHVERFCRSPGCRPLRSCVAR